MSQYLTMNELRVETKVTFKVISATRRKLFMT